MLEIDLKALEHNYNYLKSKLKRTTRFLAVVKAFGYGSDAQEVSKKLESLGVDYFAVAYGKEGVTLRDAGIKSPILVLHPLPANFDTLIDRCLEPSIYSLHVLKKFQEHVTARGMSDYPIHLKLNTGLNRLGFNEGFLEEVVAKIKESNALKVVSVFSHLAASEDEEESDFTLSQLERYANMASVTDNLLGYRPFRHVLNTSGILNYPQAQYDMVRSGIGIYGYGNDVRWDPELRPIATLKTIISQLHTIQPGETVGYNRAFKSGLARKTATLPLGHADGIGRHYGNGASFVFVHGKPARIIGNVCMDMIMIDVTDISCREGDEVIIFGSGHSAEELAASGGTISYELLTGISPRVRRIYKTISS